MLVVVFNSCCIIVIEWSLYYFAIYKCINTNVSQNGTVHFTVFLAMRLNIIIVTSDVLFIAILVTCFSPSKLGNRLKKYGLLKLFVINIEKVGPSLNCVCLIILRVSYIFQWQRQHVDCETMESCTFHWSYNNQKLRSNYKAGR